MLSGRGSDDRAVVTRPSRLLGVRTVWTAVDDGGFFCPGCGGDRDYQRLTGQRRFVLLGMPVMLRGTVGPVVECAVCRRHFGTDVLYHPTTVRLSVMLRDAVHTVALAVLAAGGAGARASLEAAVTVVRAAGGEDCTQERLVVLVEALDVGAGHFTGEPCAAGLAVELQEALGPLAPHLVASGRESIFLQGARIALADGPYTPAERDTLATVGAALTLCSTDVTRLLAVARTPS